MKMHELIKEIGAVSWTGNTDVEITSVVYDSRKAVPGALFAAVRGLAADGRDFAPQAAAAGAAAVLADAPLENDPGVPVIMVKDVRPAMALAAAAVYGHPSSDMTMIGITGTNGKTTTTYLLEAVLNRAGFSAGVIGTVDIRFAGKTIPAAHTTPEGPDLQKYMAEMREQGVSHVIMEVSSHALDLHRVEGCAFDVAIFTNLSQDHLDYHKDMEEYFQAKRRLFTQHLTGKHLPDGPAAVINVDDPHGRLLAAESGDKVLTYSLAAQADLTAAGVKSERTGLSGGIITPDGVIEVHSRLLGGLNLYNFLAATGAAQALGLSAGQISAGLNSLQGVPGRLERVGHNDDYIVLVDYAHTSDALERVLEAVRALGPKRLLAIFGCGGDRDRTKRPLMAKAAGTLADLAVLTSDNPRTEDPISIIEQVEAGLKPLSLTRLDPEQIESGFAAGSYVVIPDRRTAIRMAVSLMEAGDILVIAGKGHENYQILGRTKIHFDDREEALAALETEGKA